MSSSNLFRLSGLAALIGGALLAVVDVVDGILNSGMPDAATIMSSTWIIIQLLEFLTLALVTLGLIGIYLRQADHTSSLGFIGFLILFFGIAMLSGSIWFGAFIAPWITSVGSAEFLQTEPSGLALTGFLLGSVLFSLGGLLFGLATLRATVFPRSTAVLLIVGAVLFFALEFLRLPFSGVVISVALAWMGYILWTGSNEQVAQPDPAM
jgi:hypothetical protein